MIVNVINLISDYINPISFKDCVITVYWFMTMFMYIQND